MDNRDKMSATEIGALWMTYQKKTMILRILEYFIKTSNDETARHLMSSLSKELHPLVLAVKTTLQNEGVTVPIGFTKNDVNLEAPPVWDNGFDIMLARVLKQMSMGMYVLHMATSYREDIITLYTKMTGVTQNYYKKFTQYLLKRDFLSRPNYTVIPNGSSYIEATSYMKGTNFLGHKRPLNTVEYGLLYHSIETNITGLQLMRGFAQCSKDEDVKKYFTKGKKLSKEILRETGEILLQENIQPPATPGGTVTNSVIPPFSHKLMMFCTYLLGSFSIGGQGFSSTFSMRNDLEVMSGIHGKDVFEYIREGAKLMMSKGWFEEPPKMDL